MGGYVPEDLRKALRVIAKEEKTTVKAVWQRLVEEGVERERLKRDEH